MMSSQDMDVFGECQLEVDFVDEGDLHERFHSCSKNPEHKNFVSLKSLKFVDLPDCHRTYRTVYYISHVAQFTVKLTVDFISPDRPCTCGKKHLSKGGQCTCPRGNMRHVGSGFVSGLAGPDQLKPDVIDATKTYFILVTAAHVIFDTSEAQKTEIEFFYDDPDDRSSVRKARGVEVLNTNFEADFSEVLCVTEEKEMAGMLKKTKFAIPDNVFGDRCLKEIFDKIVFAIYNEDDEACKSLLKIMKKNDYTELIYYVREIIKIYGFYDIGKDVTTSVFKAIFKIIDKLIRIPLHPRIIECAKSITLTDKYVYEIEIWRRIFFSEQYLEHPLEEKVTEDLAVHISHPHGTSKKITFGNIVSADTRHGHYQLIYSLDTCKGSSGGPVLVIPSNIYKRDIFVSKNQQPRSISCVPHSRHHGNKLNSSSSWTEYF